MQKASGLVSTALVLIVIEIILAGLAVWYLPELMMLAFAACAMFFVYTIIFFLFSKLIKATLRDAGLWRGEGSGLSKGSAGWQMLWYLKPSAGLRRKLWFVYFLPVIALPLLIAEYAVLYFIILK